MAIALKPILSPDRLASILTPDCLHVFGFFGPLTAAHFSRKGIYSGLSRVLSKRAGRRSFMIFSLHLRSPTIERQSARDAGPCPILSHRMMQRNGTLTAPR